MFERVTSVLMLVASVAILLAILASCNTIEVRVDNGATATVTIEGELTRGNNEIRPATDVSVIPVP